MTLKIKLIQEFEFAEGEELYNNTMSQFKLNKIMMEEM